MSILLSILIATATYNGWSFDWVKGMVITSPDGVVYVQKEGEDCPTLEDDGYEYFEEWVDGGAELPDTCLKKQQ